jgi:multidrug transporter EmrE-like cation transporter
MVTTPAFAAVAAGTIDLGFAVFHILFARLFGWPDRLQASGGINAAITQTLNVVLIYIFIAYGTGLLALAVAKPGIPAAFSQSYALAGAGGWALRTALQFVYFPARRHWSAAITIVFVVAAALHGAAALTFHGAP